jgi:hypothetical protein
MMWGLSKVERLDQVSGHLIQLVLGVLPIAMLFSLILGNRHSVTNMTLVQYNLDQKCQKMYRLIIGGP